MRQHSLPQWVPLEIIILAAWSGPDISKTHPTPKTASRDNDVKWFPGFGKSTQQFYRAQKWISVASRIRKLACTLTVPVKKMTWLRKTFLSLPSQLSQHLWWQPEFSSQILDKLKSGILACFFVSLGSMSSKIQSQAKASFSLVDLVNSVLRIDHLSPHSHLWTLYIHSIPALPPHSPPS